MRTLGVARILAVLGLLVPMPSWAQEEPAPRISVQWQDEPIRKDLLALAAVGGRSIVLGPGITGTVTATV